MNLFLSIQIKRILFFIPFCLILSDLYSQNTISINFIYNTSLHEKGFYFPLLKAYSDLPYEPLSEYSLLKKDSIEKNNTFNTHCYFNVNDTSECVIGDGFGHQSFIIPGDDFSITFKKLKKENNKYVLNGKYLSPFFHEFRYEGRNKYIYSLFDSLTYNFGSLFFADGIGLSQVNFDLKAYFDTLTNTYKKRMAYLLSYHKKYQIPARFVEIAASDIKTTYINNLLNPIANVSKDYNYDDYPAEYLDTLRKMSFDNSKLFFESMLLNSFAYRYITLFQNRTSFDKETDETRFQRIWDVISHQYLNNGIQERLMACHLIANVKSDGLYFEKALDQFHAKYSNSKYRYYIDSVFNVRKSSPKITLETALSSIMTDKNGHRRQLKDIFRSNPVVIDCWASWCTPCLQQMPFSKAMEMHYAGRVDFVYLSFDKSNNLWMVKNKKLRLEGESYILNDNFKSKFANRFDIGSIPRYLIFDSNGKLVTGNAPRPSKVTVFEKVIDDLLKSKAN
jgi:thiol-disulfide isomerase/thioredoxin